MSVGLDDDTLRRRRRRRLRIIRLAPPQSGSGEPWEQNLIDRWDLANAVLDGDNVASIPSYSGGRDATATGALAYSASSINGNPGVVTDGTDYFTLAGELLLPDTGWTVYCVFRYATGSNNWFYTIGKGSPDNFVGLSSSQTRCYVKCEGNTSETQASPFNPAPGSDYLIRYRWPGSGAPSVNWNGRGSEAVMTANAKAPWSFTRLLARNTPAATGHTLCDLLVYGVDTVAASTNPAILSYLNDRYGITI